MKLGSFIIKHPVELILIIASSIITSVSFVLFYYQKDTSLLKGDVLGRQNDYLDSARNGIYYIDVSGAVNNPDLYEVTPGARLKDVIDMAGGLSTEADSLFVGRNFNMAKVLADEEKVYIPFISDIVNGTITEESKTLGEQEQNTVSEFTISINSATSEELDTLPGVGPTTAQKIIDNRPYSVIDELLDKKVVSSSTFSKIKDLIGI